MLPDDYWVVLVGDMITEEALPTYMAMLNTLDGVRDETGAAQVCTRARVGGEGQGQGQGQVQGHDRLDAGLGFHERLAHPRGRHNSGLLPCCCREHDHQHSCVQLLPRHRHALSRLPAGKPFFSQRQCFLSLIISAKSVMLHAVNMCHSSPQPRTLTPP